MEIKEYSTTESFMHDTRHFLYTKENENGVILSVCQSDPGRWDKRTLFAVFENGKVILAAWQTFLSGTYYPLGLTNTDNATAVKFLFSHLKNIEFFSHVEEVFGPINAIDLFIPLYNDAFPESPMKLFMKERSHVLTTITPQYLQPGLGKLEIANKTEHQLVVDWYITFMLETDHPHPLTEDEKTGVSRTVALDIEKNNVFLWKTDDNTPVSLGTVTRETDNVGAITLVYTPQEFRGKGYATRMVAHISKQVQEQRKKQYVSLFTDLANPTSNAIYKKVGFEPEIDFMLYQKPVKVQN